MNFKMVMKDKMKISNNNYKIKIFMNSENDFLIQLITLCYIILMSRK